MRLMFVLLGVLCLPLIAAERPNILWIISEDTSIRRLTKPSAHTALGICRRGLEAPGSTTSFIFDSPLAADESRDVQQTPCEATPDVPGSRAISEVSSIAGDGTP